MLLCPFSRAQRRAARKALAARSEEFQSTQILMSSKQFSGGVGVDNLQSNTQEITTAEHIAELV